ncbi:MAG TPA: hypothetical protein VIM22_05655, partial [Solirubrobacteraceae bacterium]
VRTVDDHFVARNQEFAEGHDDLRRLQRHRAGVGTGVVLQVMFLAMCEFAPERKHDNTWL